MRGAELRHPFSRPGGSFPSRMYAYITKEYALSFFVAFAFFFVVFLVNQILLMAEDILSRHAPAGQVVLLLIFSLPSIVAITFPFSALAGALMASARLNSDNEMQAFSACGISSMQLFSPFIVLGAIVSLISFSANDYFLPRGSAEFGKVYSGLVKYAASVELAPWSVKKFPDATVVSGPADGGKVDRLLVIDTADERGKRLLYARSAGIEVLPGGYEAMLDLSKVWEQRLDPEKPNAFSVSSAASVRYKIVLRDRIQGYQGLGPTEMSSAQIGAAIKSKNASLESRLRERASEEMSARESLGYLYGNYLAQGFSKNSSAQYPDENFRAESAARMSRDLETLANLGAQIIEDRSLQIYKVEYNKKLSIPFAAFFFSILAFPLGLGSKRAGRTAGFGIALLISVIYWGMLFVGQSLGVRNGFNPFLAIWLPNIVVLASTIIVWCVRRSSARHLL